MIFTPIKPMLLETAKEAFDSADYIYEPKMDGFRILLHKKGDRIEAFTRHGNRISDKFPELREVAASIRSTPPLSIAKASACATVGRTSMISVTARE